MDNILKESDQSRIERLSRGKPLLAQVGYHDFLDETNRENHYITNNKNEAGSIEKKNTKQ